MPTFTKPPFSTRSCQGVSKSNCRTTPSKRCSKEKNNKKRTKKGLISWKRQKGRKRKKRPPRDQNFNRKKKLSGNRQKGRKISIISLMQHLPSLYRRLYTRSKTSRWFRRRLRLNKKLKNCSQNHSCPLSRQICKNWAAPNPTCLNNLHGPLTAQNQLWTTPKW